MGLILGMSKSFFEEIALFEPNFLSFSESASLLANPGGTGFVGSGITAAGSCLDSFCLSSLLETVTNLIEGFACKATP